MQQRASHENHLDLGSLKFALDYELHGQTIDLT